MDQEFPQPDMPHVIVLCLEGDVIRHEESRFEMLIEELLEKKQRHFIMEFSSVEFIDSAGIGLIIKTANMIEKRLGALTLCNPKANVKNVFQTLGIEDRFKIFYSLGRALRSRGQLVRVEFVDFKFQ